MIYTGFLLTCLLGWLLLPPRWPVGAMARLSFAYALGVLSISLQMFAYSLVGLAWNAPALLLPWGAVAAAYLVQLRKEWPLRKRILWPDWPVWGVIAGVAAVLALWLPYERLMSLTSQSWDAWAIWLFKAKAFYLDGDITTFLSRSGEFTTQAGYPLLVPLHACFLYVLNGGVDDQAAKLLSPCSFVALLGVFYYFARRVGTVLCASAFTWMLATVPVLGLVAFEFAGYADTTLSLYLLAAGGFLAMWAAEARTADLIGGILAATAAAWTKNEGQFFLLAVLILVFGGLLRTRAAWWQWLVAAGPPAAVLGAWLLVRRAHGVEAAGFAVGISFDPELLRIALRSLLTRAVQPGLFQLVFHLFAAALAGAWWLRPPAAFWIVPGLVFWHLAGALLAYSTGRNDIHWWLGTSADRVVSQVVPLAMLASAWMMSLWLDADSPAASGSSEPASNDVLRGKRRRGRRGKQP